MKRLQALIGSCAVIALGAGTGCEEMPPVEAPAQPQVVPEYTPTYGWNWFDSPWGWCGPDGGWGWARPWYGSSWGPRHHAYASPGVQVAPPAYRAAPHAPHFAPPAYHFAPRTLAVPHLGAHPAGGFHGGRRR